AATGFIEGPLVVPQFVLRELQHIADSPDPRKRARGKRGFEVVQRLQRLPGALVEIDEVDVPGVTEVDRKLLEVAKARTAKVITTDYNLNKLAELSGGAVLNGNELATAVSDVVVAAPAEHLARTQRALAGVRGAARVQVVAGGVERQESVWLGMQAVPDSAAVIVVHDAVRPFLTRALIDRVVAAARLSG